MPFVTTRSLYKWGQKYEDDKFLCVLAINNLKYYLIIFCYIYGKIDTPSVPPWLSREFSFHHTILCNIVCELSGKREKSKSEKNNKENNVIKDGTSPKNVPLRMRWREYYMWFISIFNWFEWLATIKFNFFLNLCIYIKIY